MSENVACHNLLVSRVRKIILKSYPCKVCDKLYDSPPVTIPRQDPHRGRQLPEAELSPVGAGQYPLSLPRHIQVEASTEDTIQ